MRRRRAAAMGWPPRSTPWSGPSSRSSGSSSARTSSWSGCWSACLSKGHVLLEGVPGVAKTLAVETFARVVGGTFARIQFTPDLVPTDIIGTRIYRQGKEEFDTELGPVVVNFLLADEINRAPGEGAVGAAGGHAGTPGVDRWQEVPAAQPVPGDGHAEPDRARGCLPAARGAARPLPVQDQRRLPVAGRGARDHLPDGRDAAGAQADPEHRRPAAAAGHRGQHLRPPCAGRLRGARRHRHPPPRAARDERRQDLDLVRRIPACLAGHHRRRALAGAGARPRLRDPAGRRRSHSRRAAAPAGAHLRRAGRRDLAGDRHQPDPADRRPAAGECRSAARPFGAAGDAGRGAASGR